MKNWKILFILLPLFILFGFLIAYFNYIGLAGVIFAIVAVVVSFYVFKNPFIGLLLIIFTLPFERIPTIDLGALTLKADQIFAGITIVVWILKFVFEKYKVQKFPIFIPVVLFLFSSLISTIYAVDASRAYTVYIFVLFMIIVSFITSNLIVKKEDLSLIIKVLFYSTLVVCGFGIYQFLGDVVGLPIALTGLKDIYTKVVLGFPRIQAFSMEPLYLANYLFIPLGIFASLYFFNQNESLSKKDQLIGILLILIVIVLGISRGAYIALGVMILFFAVFLFRKVVTFKNVFVVVVSISLIGYVSFKFLEASRPDAIDQFIGHAMVNDFSNGESVQKRLKDYQKAIDFWQTSPVIGIGPGNYGPMYKNFPPHDDVTDWDIVNNQYIESLTETGVLGLALLTIIYLVIIIRSIMAFFRSKDLYLKSIMFGLLAAFIAILVQYNFFSTLYIMHIWVLIGLMIGTQNLIFKEEK
jgi:O-antigen ligase